MTEILLGVIGAMGVIAGGYFTYRSAVRQRSGSVSTTEAATLWAESSAVRKEAIERANDLQGKVDDLRSRLREVEDLSAMQARELANLRKEAEDAHRVITILQTRVEELEKKTPATTRRKQ